jgi:hypothetical protein
MQSTLALQHQLLNIADINSFFCSFAFGLQVCAQAFDRFKCCAMAAKCNSKREQGKPKVSSWALETVSRNKILRVHVD